MDTREKIDAVFAAHGPIADMDEDELTAFYAELSALEDERTDPESVALRTEQEAFREWLTAPVITRPDELKRSEAAVRAEVAKMQAIDAQHQTTHAQLSLCSAATVYATRYRLPVVPLRQDDHKKPSIRFADLPAGGLRDGGEISRHWHWKGHEHDGIAVRTGGVVDTIDGADYIMVVVDLDLHEPHNGRAALRQYLTEHPDLVPPPAVVCGTAGESGGLHVHLAVRKADIPPNIDGLGVLPGVDVLAHNRMVIMPPTYRRDKQTEYKWLGLYDWQNDSIMYTDKTPAVNNNIPPWTPDNTGAYGRLVRRLMREAAIRKQTLRDLPAIGYTPDKLQTLAEGAGVSVETFKELLIQIRLAAYKEDN